MSFEIRQGGVVCLWRWCAVDLEKQSHVSQKTVDCEMFSALRSGAFSIREGVAFRGVLSLSSEGCVC